MEINEFKKPINIIFLLLALGGIIISIYFYQISERHKEITYTVDDIASKIYDSKNAASSLHLLDKDSIPIKETVYLIRGKIWNSGNLPINNSDVRLPLKISLASCKKILDFKIGKQYKDGTQKFSLSKLNEKNLVVNWKYFDPKNGFSYQVIYLGLEKPNVSLRGKILDIDKFKNIDEENQNKKWYSFLYMPVGLLFGFFADKLSPSIFGHNSKLSLWFRLLLIITIGGILTYIALKIIEYFTITVIPF